MPVLILTNLYPTQGHPLVGMFVKQEVDTLREGFPEFDLDVLHVDGINDRWNYIRGVREFRNRLARRPYGVVHAHYGLTGVIARCQRRVPVVVTFRGSDVKFVRWQAAVSKALARVIDRGIVVAEWMIDELGSKNLVVIPGGVDLDLFRPGDQLAARRALNLPGQERIVLFPGSPRTRAKNVRLFDAVVRVVEARGVAVCRQYLDGLPREQVPVLMNAADVMVLTSHAEGSPNSVKEACACNLPVVSVDTGDVRERIEGLRNCHVTSHEPNSIADAVIQVLASNARSNGRTRVLHLDRFKMAERVAQVYREVASWPA